MKDRIPPKNNSSGPDKKADMNLIWKDMCLNHENVSSPNWYDQVFQNNAEKGEDVLSKLKCRRPIPKNRLEDN